MVLEIRNLSFGYHGRFSVGPISLSIPKGSFVTLMGANGSGKSTLFSLLSGRYTPNGGEILIDKTPLRNLSSRKRARCIGVVPPLGRSTFDYSVLELITMGRYPYHSRFSSISLDERKIIQDLIDQLHLSGFENRPVSSLSDGEYQRVMIARGMAQQPEILLLDEPGSHLDLRHREETLRLLWRDSRRGRTVVAVLHDVNMALQYADIGILMRQGKMIASGAIDAVLTPQKIRETYDVEMEAVEGSGGRNYLLPRPIDLPILQSKL